MEVYLDVLGLSLEDWVTSQVNTNDHIVVVEENQIHYENAQIL